MITIKIPQGWHWRVNHLLNRFKIGRHMQQSYLVRFCGSCRYELSENKTQVNKLVGVGHLHHHLNSIRVGWRYNADRDQVELLAYRYKNGVRDYIHCCWVEVNDIVSVDVDYTYSKGAITASVVCDGGSVQYEWKVQHWYEKIPFLYECFPYFGGSQPAPHSININIERIK